MSDKRYTHQHGFVVRLVEDLSVIVFRILNCLFRWQWHKLPFPKLLGLWNLYALRVELRRHNLHDTDGDLTIPKPESPFHATPEGKMMRTESGTQNDLQYPAMGCRRSRLGRNVPRDITAPDAGKLMQPNPLLVSQKLLARDEFKPAETLNLLAAAWIQFQVHDWFGHEKEARNANPNSKMMLCVPQAGDWKQPEMVIPKTKPDPDKVTPLDTKYPAYRNEDPQWWDGSQVYGECADETSSLRTNPDTGQTCPHGKLYLNQEGFLRIDPSTKLPITGFTDNWWLGLEILHTLFAKEHNAICDHIKASEPEISGDDLFEKARLVNCAIMAKIHTVEWTPGILGHPSIQPALDANWMGLLGHFCDESTAREWADRFPKGMREFMTGIPLSETDHHGAPYALTEEFAAVYRLHPLIPEQVVIRSHKTGEQLGVYTMDDIVFDRSRSPITRGGATMEDAIYSFGTSNPGRITIKNYPKFLRELTLPPDATGVPQVLDLAAVDILRDRERGVPRYNEFRRQLRQKPVRDWKELANGDEVLAEELKDVYCDDLEAVDTMVGMFCEPLPDRFGFSDTAFRIFILMASRRLKSDRFFTTDYREEYYTRAGLDWICNTRMKEVILRHHPSLLPAFEDVSNPFAPWRKVANLQRLG